MRTACRCLQLALLLLWADAGMAQTAAPADFVARATDSAAQAFSRGQPVPDWIDTTVTAPDTVSQAPLVIRLSDFQAHVDQESEIYVHYMSQANEASMLTTEGRIEIAFQPEYQKVALHYLHVLRGTTVMDKTGEAEIHFLQREQSLNEGIYTGLFTASIVVDDIRVGDTVDIAYSIKGQNPVFGGKFLDSATWASAFPIQRKRVTLNAPADRKIFYRIIGDGMPIQIREQKTGNRQITRFAGDNLPSVDVEQYAPSEINQFRQIQFSEFKNWQQVAQWADALFSVKPESNAVDEVTANMIDPADPEKAVQRALDYVQNEIRYLSLSLGENSHKPFPPDVVIARRYGDCKDKALLLVTLLRRLGFEAEPVLISTTAPKGQNRYLPSPVIFNHAIVRTVVNGKAYFLDATRSAQYGPLDNMGQSHAGAEVLIIDPQSDHLAIVPPDRWSAQLSNVRTEHVLVRKVDGPAEMKVLHHYAGLEAEIIRFYVARQTKDQLRRSYLSWVLQRYPNASTTAAPVVTDNRQDNSLDIEMNYRIPGYLEKTATGWKASYSASNMKERFYVPQSPRRNQALIVPTEPAMSRYVFELILPDDFDAEYKPFENTISNTGFLAKNMLTFKGHVAQATVDLSLRADRVPAAEVPAYVADVRKLGVMISNEFAIHKSDLKKDNLHLLLDTPLKQRLMDQQQESVNKNTLLINEAHTAGAPAGEALCARGMSYAQLGKKQDALNDIQSALATAPTSLTLLRCRAGILFTTGDMKAGLNDFAKVIAAGNAEAQTLFQVGMSNYELGKYREAADAFAQSVEQSAGPEEKMRAEIMRMIAVQHSVPHRTVSTAFADQNDWPGIMVNVINGSKSEDDVLRQIHHRTDDELEYALSDGYYYLAQLNLMAGNRIKATVYLTRAADKGILTSPLYPAMRLELDKLHK